MVESDNLENVTYKDLYIALRVCCILALQDNNCGSPERAVIRIQSFLESLERIAPKGKLPD